MNGTIVLCSIHAQVYNVHQQRWMDVPQEAIDEFKEMAEELGGVDVHEGICPSCSEVASKSFQAYYYARYSQAAYRECGSEVRLPWEDTE